MAATDKLDLKRKDLVQTAERSSRLPFRRDESWI